MDTAVVRTSSSNKRRSLSAVMSFGSPVVVVKQRNNVCLSMMAAADAQPPPMTTTEFEAVVNTPALGAFLFIVVVFGLLQLRINSVTSAVEKRQDALDGLRQVKAKELSSLGADRPSPEQLENAMALYKDAIDEEERLRTVGPGIRIVAPGVINNSPENVSAAKQFLGVDLQSTDNNDDDKEDDDDARKKGAAGSGLPPMAVGVLVLVGLSQLALLYFLSFDPMATPTGFVDIYTVT